MPLRKDVESRTDLTPAERRCLSAAARIADDGSPRWLAEFRALQADLGQTPCVLYGLSAALQAVPLTRATPDPEELRLARALSQHLPGHPTASHILVNALQRLSRHREAFEAAMAGARASEHPVHRQRIELVAMVALEGARDSARRIVMVEQGDSIARADGRPLIRYYSLISTRLHHPSSSRRARAGLEELAIARAASTRVYEAQSLVNQHTPGVEAGRMNEALAAIQPLADWVERHELHEIAMRLRHLEGRALVRSGRPAAAIPALGKALRAGRLVGNTQFIAEAYHQLTHAHEAMANWPAASAASRQFIAHAQQSPDPGVRVISYNDAALVHRKAGWNAASDSLYELMVHAIEREGVHFAFAADHFERTGRFGDAMRYVRRALSPQADGHVPDRNVLLATLTRLHLALGNLDSAMATAIRHDSISTITDETLVPRVLVARGEHSRAVETMRRWTAMQAGRGNVRGQLSALLSLAEGLVSVAPPQAASVAAEADSLARTQSFLAERVTALRLRGQALMPADAALAASVLASARELGVAHASALDRILVDVALGDALSRTGAESRALAAFDAAIRGIEAVDRGVSDDVMRSRFRAARADAFNGALRVVGQMPDAGRSNALLGWSARKKRVAATVSRSASPRMIRRQLPASHALLDYVVIDSTIVATVVSRDTQVALPLPMNARDVWRLADRIVRPFSGVHGGRVDLARAPFDSSAARTLHAGLVTPLLPYLRDIRTLTIVPDAPIHAVPFDALMAGDRQFLIDRFTLRFALAPGVPHATAVARSAALTMVVGDAPGAEEERERVPGRWRGPVKVLHGAAASETRVLGQRAAGTILHVATHARSNDRDPFASYLALSADTVNDGLLHYAEVERLGARYELVVLNACETAAGALLPGSGFMSLGRAFLVSGSKSVVATQWPVGAASAVLAEHFYAAVQRGTGIDAALREAKLAVRRDSATAHPFFWASHVLLQR